jgi:hypothetical protein
VLWRLNAESPVEAKFDHAEMVERVARFRHLGHATGPAGFAPGMELSAVLLPRGAGDRPLALGVLYPASAPHDAEALVETLKHGAAQVFSGAPEAPAGPFVRAV